MSNLRETLSDLAKGLTEENCDVSLAQYCFWLNVGVAHGHISDQSQVSNDVHRIIRPELLRPDQGQLIHPAVQLLTRFIRDIESDGTISEQVSGLRQNCAENVDAFFEENLSLVRSRGWQAQSTTFLTKANLIAFWANLGYVEEVVIRDRIIQSLLSHSKLHDHQADALVVLFGLAGGTFGAYVDPSVVDRCFELLKDHYGYWSAKRKPILVSTPFLRRGTLELRRIPGGDSAAGEWLEGSPSSAGIHDWQVKPDRSRLQRNYHRHTSGAFQYRSISPDPSAQSTKTSRRPEDQYDPRTFRHPGPDHQHR